MNYQIALDPTLGIAAADLVSAWNKEPERAAQAEATLSPSTEGTFMPEAMEIVTFLGTTVGHGAYYEWIVRRAQAVAQAP